MTLAVLRALDSLPGPSSVRVVATRASMSEQGATSALHGARRRQLARVDGVLWAITDAGRDRLQPPDMTVICSRVRDRKPATPSTRSLCSKCGAEVWVAEATSQAMSRYKRPQIVCLACRPLLTGTMVTTAAQRAEIEALGVADGPERVADLFDMSLVDLDDPDVT